MERKREIKGSDQLPGNLTKDQHGQLKEIGQNVKVKKRGTICAYLSRKTSYYFLDSVG